jgi:hypothetical protein
MGLLKLILQKEWLITNQFIRGGREKKIAGMGSIFHAEESTNVGTVSNKLSGRKECY